MVSKDYKYTKEEMEELKSQYDGYGYKLPVPKLTAASGTNAVNPELPIKDVIPKYTDYNGMIEFSKALRKYYEVSTPESRDESYKPWLADNVIDTTGTWYKGHRKLRKEKDIVKDVVYVLATTLNEEVNKNVMQKDSYKIEDNVTINVIEQPKDYADNTPTFMEAEVLSHELKVEKRMQKITMAVTAVFGCILLYVILYKL